MEGVVVTQEMEPSADFLRPIKEGLRAYNERLAGPNPRREIALRAESAGSVVGGAFGWFHWGWLYTDWLWVADGWRGRKLGTELLQKLEGLGRDAGLRRARLNTASFQALDFYLKLGYRVFAELPITSDDGTEHVDYFLRKEL